MLKKALRSACAIALLTCLMGASGSAQTYDKRTVFAFSGPVALPGVTLPAGQYLFRLADPASSRKVVQVLSADGKTPYGMFFSIADLAHVACPETTNRRLDPGDVEGLVRRRADVCLRGHLLVTNGTCAGREPELVNSGHRAAASSRVSTFVSRSLATTSAPSLP